MKALTPGTMLGGDRYAVVGKQWDTPLGPVFRAIDQTTRHPVSLLALDGALVEDNMLPVLKARVAAFSGVRSKQVLNCETLLSEGEQNFIVSEFIEGQPLQGWFASRHAEGELARKAVASVMTHLCTGLESIHALGAHALISPDTVVVNQAGRVRICFVGLSPLAPAAHRHERRHAFSDPSVLKRKPDAASDVYSLGAMLYWLVTGHDPAPGCTRPSQQIPGVSPHVDTFVGQCMHPTPSKRPRTMAQIKGAINTALLSEAAPEEDSGIAEPSQVNRLPKEAAPVAAPAALGSEDESEKWIITKGRLDYGPFSFTSIVEQLDSSEILPGHMLMDNGTGERCPIEEHPLFRTHVASAKIKRDDLRRANAEADTMTQEKRRGFTLYAFIVLLVGGLGIGAYFLVSVLSSDSGKKSAAMAGLGEAKLAPKITFPTLDKGARSKRTRRKGSKGQSSSSGGDEWDDSLDLDMASAGGGSERLDPSQINPVLNRSIGKLGSCLQKNGGGRAAIDYIILGSGKVSQVRVNQQTGTGLAKCVRKTMMSMQFPSFNGPRTRGNFELSF